MEATLTPLPYPYDALEPTLNAETVRIHHTHHQAAYVKGWNTANAELRKGQSENWPSINEKAQSDWMRSVSEEQVFNAAGVILHEMYWENLCPIGQGGGPSSALVNHIDTCFGSLQEMLREMIQVGTAIDGSGWIILVWVPRFQQLVIQPTQIHEMRWIPGVMPLIVIDVWEHAYYLNYQSSRAKYLTDIWKNVNWHTVNNRFQWGTK